MKTVAKLIIANAAMMASPSTTLSATGYRIARVNGQLQQGFASVRLKQLPENLPDAGRLLNLPKLAEP
jgi:hypothetical protein